MGEPRRPLAGHLGSVEVVLGVVDPTLTSWDLLARVVVLEVAVSERVGADCGSAVFLDAFKI